MIQNGERVSRKKLILVRTELDKTFNRYVGICSEVIGEKNKAKQEKGTQTEIPEQFLKDLSLITKENCQKCSIAELTLLSKHVSVLAQEKEKELDKKEAERNKVLYLIGNLVMDECVISSDEDFNKVIKEVGDKKPQTHEDGWKRLGHVDIMTKLEGLDTINGSKVAGERGYFLKGKLMILHMALAQYAMTFLTKRDFCPILPPFFMNKSIMSEVAQLEQFDEELYKVTGDGEEKYLIATSEQPIASYHRGERLDDSQLPIRYAGYSTCFRKEVGSHGKDTLGIFRVHQFDKIEQFCITSPKVNEKTNRLFSEEMFDEMIGNCEEFYQNLGLPYHIVSIVSGKLNNAAAKKYDLEAWFPASQKYRELVSCSNCTTYQSRRLDIKYGKTSLKSQGVSSEYVHMLNCTMCATTRTLCCIVENYQTKDGIDIPKVLQPFMSGQEKILYPVKEKKEKKKDEKKDEKKVEKKVEEKK